MKDIYDLAYAYADEVIQSKDFQRMLELKNLIKQTLSNKIIAFRTAEAKYLEVKQYGKYHPDLEKYQHKFADAKKNLYSEALVQEYKKLEMKIQQRLNQDMNSLKQSVSNKYKLDIF